MYLTKIIISWFVLFLYAILRGRLPKWNGKIFSYAFIFSFLGYEMWFSFGLIHGDSARTRGSPIPNLNNALINSLGDALVSVAMVDLVIWKYGKKAFKKWDWRAFVLFFTIGNIQNIFVTLAFLPRLQGERLSLSPLTPFRVSPTLLTQEAWIIYPFLFYLFLIHRNIIS